MRKPDEMITIDPTRLTEFLQSAKFREITLNVALSKGVDASAAQDIAQAATVAVLKEMEKSGEIGDAIRFVRKTVRFLIISEHRYLKRRSFLRDEHKPLARESQDPLQSLEDYERAIMTFFALTREERLILYAKLYRRTQHQLADEMGIADSTLTNRKKRAKDRRAYLASLPRRDLVKRYNQFLSDSLPTFFYDYLVAPSLGAAVFQGDVYCYMQFIDGFSLLKLTPIIQPFEDGVPELTWKGKYVPLETAITIPGLPASPLPVDPIFSAMLSKDLEEACRIEVLKYQRERSV